MHGNITLLSHITHLITPPSSQYLRNIKINSHCTFLRAKKNRLESATSPSIYGWSKFTNHRYNFYNQLSNKPALTRLQAHGAESRRAGTRRHLRREQNQNGKSSHWEESAPRSSRTAAAPSRRGTPPPWNANETPFDGGGGTWRRK